MSWAMPREDGGGRQVRIEARARETKGRLECIMVEL